MQKTVWFWGICQGSSVWISNMHRGKKNPQDGNKDFSGIWRATANRAQSRWTIYFTIILLEVKIQLFQERQSLWVRKATLRDQQQRGLAPTAKREDAPTCMEHSWTQEQEQSQAALHLNSPLPNSRARNEAGAEVGGGSSSPAMKTLAGWQQLWPAHKAFLSALPPPPPAQQSLENSCSSDISAHRVLQKYQICSDMSTSLQKLNKPEI